MRDFDLDLTDRLLAMRASGLSVEVERARDNSGTFVYAGGGDGVFVHNTSVVCGRWLYYSTDVAAFFAEAYLKERAK